MKKYKIQTKQEDKILKTNFRENLNGMSLIEALIIFTLRHSYGVIKKGLKPINFNENQNSKILPKIADNAAKISEIEIFNALGEKIVHHENEYSAEILNFDISENTRGVYFIKITSGDMLVNYKIVLQ